MRPSAPAATRLRALQAFFLCGLCLNLIACSTLNQLKQPAPAAAGPTLLGRPVETRLGKELLSQVSAHPGLSGFYLLTSGMDAFLARALMIDAAVNTIELQYYIVDDDLTTQLLFLRILKAADRGVKVRMLIDGIHGGSSGLGLAHLNAHPNIQVRIFNPSGYRLLGSFGKPLELLLRWREINRRMHNKLLAVDGQAAIVGGRNLADGYYEARPGLLFMDLDLWSVGPIVGQLERSFNEYWDSTWAKPITHYKLLRRGPADVEAVRRHLAECEKNAETTEYAANLKNSDLLERLERGGLPLVWAAAEPAYDRPRKVDGGSHTGLERVGANIGGLARQATREIVFVSPYFIPEGDGMKMIGDLRRRGVRVLVLTNALTATDIVPAYAAFAPYRLELLRMGVEIYELKPTAAFEKSVGKKLFGHRSQSSLHAKTYLFDRREVLIGSFNLDPRSKNLNTELGLVVHSPELGGQVAALIAEAMGPKNSYHVRMATPAETAEHGSDLVWETADEAGHPVRLYHQPGKGYQLFISRVMLRIFPLEGLL